MTKISKSQVGRFTRKLYRFLEQGHTIELRKMRRYRGQIWTREYPTIVKLDPRERLIPTLVHEALHYFNPDASERWVLEMEKLIVTKLTECQNRNIIKKLAECLDKQTSK